MPARLCPKDEVQSLVLAPSELLSMRLQWFTHVRLLVAHLTRSCRVFSRNAHHDGSLPPQLPVVWTPRLHGEPGGPYLHHWHSTVRAGDLLHRHHVPFRTHDLPKLQPILTEYAMAIFGTESHDRSTEKARNSG